MRLPIRIAQILFALLIALAIGHAVQLQGRFLIDTGLADVAPDIADSTQTHNAIQALRRNIEQRILLLVSGTDEDQVYDALDELSAGLEQIKTIKQLPDTAEVIEQLIIELEPYRFNLLSERQAQRLRTESVAQLAEAAERDATSISSASLYPFAKDPFGISSNSLFDVLQQLQSDVPEDTNLSYQSLALAIQGDALNMRQQQQLSTELNRVIESVLANYDVSIDRSGIFFFAAHAAQQSKKDISLISTVSTVGVIILLLFVFRSLLALTLPVVSVLLGVSFAFIATHTVFGSVHVLTIVFGASLIGIVIDYSLHYFYHSAAHHDVGAQRSNQQAENKALHQALLLSLCTSLIGYAALSLSGLDALNKVALFSCCGLVMAWLSVVSLGPLATRRGLTTEGSVLPKLVRSVQGWFSHVSTRIIAVLGMTVVALAALNWFASKPFSDDPRVFFTAPANLLASERRVAAVANDYEPGRYVLLLGDSIAQIQGRYQQMRNAVVANSDVPETALSSVFSMVPSQAKQAEAHALQAKLYGDKGALNALAFELNMASDMVENLRSDYSSAATKVLTPEQVAVALGEALPPMWFASETGYVGFVLIKKGVNADALGAALTNLDGIEYVNTLEKTQSALAEQRQSASALLLIAYMLVAGLLIIRFRSLTASSMVLVPLASTAMLVLLTVPLGYQLNLFHIMSLFLVLGFGMDYTIFAREMREHQAQTLQAILLSAITSLLSFGLLAASSIPVVASFGTALLIGNGFNLVGAFAYSRIINANELKA